MFSCIFLTLSVIAQVPESFNYQAVLRDASWNVKANSDVVIDVAILRGSSSGPQVFIETHDVQTNEFGLVTLKVGSKNQSGFSDIDWASDLYFVKITVDGTEMGVSQILSVPYAMYAKNVENDFSGDYNDLTNQPSLFSGSYYDLTDKPTLFSGSFNDLVGLPTTLGGYGITNAMSTSHPANSITNTNISNWNTAYGWGNHSGKYKLITYLPAWSEISNKPTTLAGYGITDAVSTFGNQSISGIKTFTGTINASNKVITSVANPSNPTDAANKAYVDLLLDRIEALEYEINVVTDVDGNKYHTLDIGTQEWFAKPLITTRFLNGDPIPTTSQDLTGEVDPKYQFVPNGEESNAELYGRLYTWYAVMDSRGLCPSGWHVPSDADWTTLENTLGGSGVAGGKLKEAGTTHWKDPNEATNESGFTALPSGHRAIPGGYEWFGIDNYLWTTTPENETYAWGRKLAHYTTELRKFSYQKKYGFTVRCVKD